MYELTLVSNKCVELQFEVKMELSNYEIPSLRRETESKELEKMQLQLHKEEMTLLLQKIVDKIGDEMEKIFSEYLTERPPVDEQ